MAHTVFKKIDYSLDKLLADIEMGEIALPDIQRPFVWDNAKVRDLFDSMYKGFPVGYFLFWASPLTKGTKGIGTDLKQHASRLLIVDGQQRLTSLYAVLKGLPVLREDFSEEHIRISFRPRDAEFEVANAATDRDPEFLADISRLWAKDTTRNKVQKAFFERLRVTREVPDDEEEALIEAIDRLYDLHNYPFTAMELSGDLDEERVAEVFVRINSKGKTLTQSDFILTLMSVFWEDGRKAIEDFCRSAKLPAAHGASSFNHFIKPDPDQLLRVSVGLGFRRARLKYGYQLLRGKDLQTGEVSVGLREAQFKVLKETQAEVLDLTRWHEFLKVLLRAGHRSGQTINSETSLLYAYVFYLIGRRDFGVEPFALREVIARWFFMISLTKRYSGSFESDMEKDLQRLEGISSPGQFEGLLDGLIQEALTEDFWHIGLPAALATSANTSPEANAYYAALNLLEARVLFSKMKVSELLDPATKTKKAPLERHHLFPKNYLKGEGITKVRETNQIANFALVEWTDNNDISDEGPATYFPAYAARFTPEELAQMHHWHALPDGWHQMDYDEFLLHRRKLMAKVIREGFGKLKAAVDQDPTGLG